MASDLSWLTSNFHFAATERASWLLTTTGVPCWLAQHDPEHLPCEGRIEGFHFISQQRVRHALGGILPPSGPCLLCGGSGAADDGSGCLGCAGSGWLDLEGLIDLAIWDSRNAGPGCQVHHRRLDSHLTPSLVVPAEELPFRVREYAMDWGLEAELEHKYPWSD